MPAKTEIKKATQSGIIRIESNEDIQDETMRHTHPYRNGKEKVKSNLLKLNGWEGIQEIRYKEQKILHKQHDNNNAKNGENLTTYWKEN